MQIDLLQKNILKSSLEKARCSMLILPGDYGVNVFKIYGNHSAPSTIVIRVRQAKEICTTKNIAYSTVDTKYFQISL